jgi:pimeloyl-ACP methyl ester carboxylesterase
MWGAQLALDLPDRVTALVLMDTFVGPEPPATQARYFAMLDVLERAGCMPPAMVEQVVPLFFSPETLSGNPALVDRFRRSLLDLSGERLPSIVALGRAIFSRPSLLERLPAITCPSLVVVGRDDRSRPVPEAEIMAKAIPGARLEVIEAAGHISNLEQPDRVLGLLEEFLRCAR